MICQSDDSFYDSLDDSLLDSSFDTSSYFNTDSSQCGGKVVCVDHPGAAAAAPAAPSDGSVQPNSRTLVRVLQGAGVICLGSQHTQVTYLNSKKQHKEFKGSAGHTFTPEGPVFWWKKVYSTPHKPSQVPMSQEYQEYDSNAGRSFTVYWAVPFENDSNYVKWLQLAATPGIDTPFRAANNWDMVSQDYQADGVWVTRKTKRDCGGGSLQFYRTGPVHQGAIQGYWHNENKG